MSGCFVKIISLFSEFWLDLFVFLDENYTLNSHREILMIFGTLTTKAEVDFTGKLNLLKCGAFPCRRILYKPVSSIYEIIIGF